MIQFLFGLQAGCVLFALRRVIDQRNFLFVEALVVLAALLLAPTDLILLACPVLVSVRLLERKSRGETLLLIDLFRLTTACALAALAFATVYDNPFQQPAISRFFNFSAIVFTFVLANLAYRSEARARNMAIAFSAGMMLFAALQVALGDGRGSGYFVGFTPDAMRLPSNVSPIGLLLNLYALVTAILLTTPLMHFLLAHSRWLHQLGHFLAAELFKWGKPSDLMRITPVMKLWSLRPQVTYLNHGSFGALPYLVQDRRNEQLRRVEAEPMDVLVREYDQQWHSARLRLASWLGTEADNIAFCENATSAMNELAGWFPLAAGDEVILNDHEYGAVARIWQRACQRSGATLRTVQLPEVFESTAGVTQPILDACNDRTKLVVFSHITSPTAILLPVQELCDATAQRGIASCVDGPHALLQEPVNLHRLGCDFYTASCHKWLCAPLGSGFVYVAPRWQEQVQPLRLSWGRLPPHSRDNWSHELLWSGSRDISTYLTIPAAQEFFSAFDRTRLDQRNHALARYARDRLLEIAGTEALTPDSRQWYGWMAAAWLPPADHGTLQNRLWENYRIEVPIVHHNSRYLIRVSCHLYNATHDIDYLIRALQHEVADSKKTTA